MGIINKFKEGLKQGVKEEKEKQDQRREEKKAREWLAKKEAQEGPSEAGKTVGHAIQKVAPVIVPLGKAAGSAAGAMTLASRKVTVKAKVAVENYAKNQAKAIKSGKAKDPFIVRAPPGAGLDNMLAPPRSGGIGGNLDGVLGLPAMARPPRTANLSRGAKKKRNQKLRRRGISNEQRGWRPGDF